MRHLSLLLVLLLASMPVALVGAEPPTATQPAPALHYKAELGLMPPAFAPGGGGIGLAQQAAEPFPYLEPALSIPTGSWAQVLATADLTGNGQTEVALATASNFDPANDEQLHLFAQEMTAILTRTQRLPAGQNPESLLTADFDHDGRSDVALALAGADTIQVYTQTTGSGLVAAQTLPLPGGPNALAAGDFTGDGFPDLAAVAPLSDTIALWQSTPAGLEPLPFALPYPTGGFDALAAGDLDNDGDDDLAALRGAGFASDSVVVYLQTGGFFPITSTLSPETGGFLPHSLAVGDVSGDGRDDLVVTAGGNTPNAFVNVFLQTDSGLDPTPIVYPAFNLPSAVAIGDLDHDGRNDVATLHDAWRTLSVYTQTTSSALFTATTAAVPFSDRYRPDALAQADLDSTGSLDVALVDRDNGLTVLLHTLSGPVARITAPPLTATVDTALTTTVQLAGNVAPPDSRVQVRLRGQTDWLTATVSGDTWQAELTLPDTERFWTLEARAIDAGGIVQAPPDQRRIATESGPPVGSILINQGAAATNQPTVTLTLPASDASGVAAMRFSPDGADFGPWLTYTATFSWTFAAGDGEKSLYVQYRDTLTNTAAPAMDSILLDTLPPTSEITTMPATTTNRLLQLAWTGSDSGSGVAAYDLQLRRGDSGPWESLVQRTTETAASFTVAVEGRYCIRSRAIDGAGNVEAWPPGDGDTCITVEPAIAIDGLQLVGPATGTVGVPAPFTAQVAPSDATIPITYTWQASDLAPVEDTTGLSSTIPLVWDTAGTKTVQVTAANIAGSRTATATITIVPPVVAPITVTLTGPTSGNVDEPLVFAAQVAPADTTLPLTYTWQAEGQQPVVRSLNALTDTLTVTWAVTGTRTITVSAANAGGTVVATRTVQLDAPDQPTVPIAPVSLQVQGPTSAPVNTATSFTATVAPTDTTVPLTYTWLAEGQQPVVRSLNTLTDTLSLTWATTGSRTITVTATNAGGGVTATASIRIDPDNVPDVPVAGVQLDGPASGMVSEPYTFTATVDPADATPPFTYTWRAEGQQPVTRSNQEPTDAVVFTWATTGTRTITVTVTGDGGGSATASTSITLNDEPEDETVVLTGISIDGPRTGLLNTTYTFTATVTPADATLPITYTWQASAQDDQTTTVADERTSVGYSWSITGTQTITVTASNGLGAPVSASHSIAIRPRTITATERVYLPLVQKE